MNRLAMTDEILKKNRVTLYYWRKSQEAYGHVALRTYESVFKEGGYYISLWPIKTKGYGSPSQKVRWHKSLEEDIAGEGREPTQVLDLYTLDAGAINGRFASFQYSENDISFHLFGSVVLNNNANGSLQCCSSLVYHLLLKGGLKELLKNTKTKVNLDALINVITPGKIKSLCKSSISAEENKTDYYSSTLYYYNRNINRCLALLHAPQDFSLNVLKELCENADNPYVFRFPYTLACIFRIIHPEVRQDIDRLIVSNLEVLHTKLEFDYYKILFKLLLNSALAKKIITTEQKNKLDIYNASTDIGSKLSAVKQLQAIKAALVNDVLKDDRNQLRTRFLILQHSEHIDKINANGNIHLDNFNINIHCEVVKITLALLSFQEVDDINYQVDFSDMEDTSSKLLGLDLDDIDYAVGNNKLVHANTSIINGLKSVEIAPDDFFKIWYKTALKLRQTNESTHSLSSSASFFNTNSTHQVVPENHNEQHSKTITEANHYGYKMTVPFLIMTLAYLCYYYLIGNFENQEHELNTLQL